MSQKIICAGIVMGALLFNSATITSSATASHSSTPKKLVTSSEEPKIVLKINGENITWKNYLSTLEESPGVNEILQNRKNATGFAALETLTKETALIHLCKAKGIHVTPAEVQKKFDEIKKEHPEFDKLLKSSSVSESHMKHDLMMQQYEYKFVTFGIVISEKDITDFYQKNNEEYTTPTKYKLRLILLADEAKKEEVDKKIKGGAKFEDLAKEFSGHPSKNEGGSIPPCSKEQLPPELKTELEKLKPSEVSSWIKLGNKSFKFKLDEIIPESKQPLDAKLKSDIKERLLVEKGSEKNKLNESILNYLSQKKIECLYGKYQPRFNQFLESIKEKVKAEKEAKLKKAQAEKKPTPKPSIKSETKAPEKIEAKAPEKTEVKESEKAETRESEKTETKVPEKIEAKESEKTEVKESEKTETRESEKTETKAHEKTDAKESEKS